MKNKWLHNNLAWLKPHSLLTITAVLLSVSLYLFQIGGLIGLSPAEVATVATNRSVAGIMNSPANAPYQLSSWLFLQMPIEALEIRARLASVATALLSIGLLYALIRRWYGAHNALISLLLFAPSGWLLHTGRYGTGLIMLTCMVISLVAAASWVSTSKPNGRYVLIFALTASVAIFVPAGIWFVIAAACIVRRNLISHANAASPGQLAASVSAVVTSISLLCTVFILRPGLVKSWLGLPSQFPEATVMLTQAMNSLTYFIARGPNASEYWLAHTPILDIASTAFFVIGAIFFAKHYKCTRVQLLAAFMSICVVLIATNGPSALAYAAPLIYLTVMTGIVYILRQWSTVFPRNPIARNVAYTMVITVLVTIVVFHTQRYFVAWRKNPDTTHVYYESNK